MNTNSDTQTRAYLTIESITEEGVALRNGLVPTGSNEFAARWLEDETLVMTTVTGKGTHHMVTTNRDDTSLDTIWLTPISEAAYAAADHSMAQAEVSVVNPDHFVNLAA